MTDIGLRERLKEWKEEDFEERKTGDVLRIAIERSVVSFSNADEVHEFMERLEREARIILSQKSRSGIIDAWRETQVPICDRGSSQSENEI